MTDSAPIVISTTYAMPCKGFISPSEMSVSFWPFSASSWLAASRDGQDEVGARTTRKWRRKPRESLKTDSETASAASPSRATRRRCERRGRRRGLALTPSRNRPFAAGRAGVNWQRSGFRSTSGVPSRQSSPLTSSAAPSRLTSVASAVPIGFGRTGERSANVPRVAPSLAGLWRTRSRRDSCSQ